MVTVLVEQALQDGLIVAAGTQPQPHRTEVGQVGQGHVLRQLVLDALQPLGDGALALPGGQDGYRAQQVRVQVLALEAAQDLVLHQVGHLVGHAGHADHDLVVLFHPQAGGGAPLVDHDFGPGGQAALLAVSVVGLAAVALVELDEPLPGGVVEAQLGAEVVGQHPLGDVVLGGAQAAGHQYDVGLLQRPVQSAHNAHAGVADAEVFHHVDALLVQGGGHVGRVGVGHLADEYLVADGKNGCLHNINR